MTQPQPAADTPKFDIVIPVENGQEIHFVNALLHGKEVWRTMFEQAFNVTFNREPFYDVDTVTVYFTTPAENAQAVRDGYNMMRDLFSNKIYINESEIQKIAGKVYGNIEKSQPKAPANNNSQSGQFNKQGARKGPYKFQPRTDGQKTLAAQIRNDNHDLVFGIGPAGTGKTHVAVAMAVEALKDHTTGIKKIVLCRPAVGSGKDLGAMPGDLNTKLAPFMQPLYDELAEVMGADLLKKKMEFGEVEIVAAEMIQGRTLKNAYIIFDEAQNMTIDQIKLALTRQGDNSKVIVTGSTEQIVLKDKSDSGLPFALDYLEGVQGVAVTRFSAKDVVRHEMVQRVIEAFDRPRVKKAENQPQP